MILDSSFLIDLLEGDRGAAAKLTEIRNRPLSVPTLVYTEVAVGLVGSSEPAKTFDQVMEQVSLVAYDAEAARRTVDLQRGLLAEGEPIGTVDAMIAGTAMARDESVVTRNASEFERTPVRVSPY